MRRLARQPAPARDALEHALVEAERGTAAVEESREILLVLDEKGRLLACSRRAREAIEGLEEGALVPEELLRAAGKRVPFTATYQVAGQTETLVYLTERGDLAAYEELRAGFTAAVSHELRTPLARLLALLETAALPGFDPQELVARAQAEVATIRELIDDVLFLSELETGSEVVALGSTQALRVLREVAEQQGDRAARAGVTLTVEGDGAVELPLRPRMLRVIAENLIGNAIRYAGPGANFRLSVGREQDGLVLTGSDDGIGVSDQALPRLFERFYRADPARSSPGTGLGLAIVKHIVSAAGGTVEAVGASGQGLTIRCLFPGS